MSSRGTDALTCYFFRLQLDVGVDTCICGVDGEHELNVIHNTRVMQKKKKNLFSAVQREDREDEKQISN